MKWATRLLAHLFSYTDTGVIDWSPTPILFRLSSHRRRLRVLTLEPVRRTSRPVTRSQALRDNPLQPHLAGVAEHHITLRVLKVVIQPNAWAALAQDAGERRLAHLDRLAPEPLSHPWLTESFGNKQDAIA